MRTLTSLAVSLVLASAALPAAAGQKDNENLTQCKSELRKVFGDNTRMKLKSMKRSSGNVHMRIQAKPADGESQMVTCWVDSSGLTNLVDKAGVALTTPAMENGEKVSLNN
jgi:hypothetical protein